ncbi:substrate-binding domain-containing protein [Notoacmeibacter ruber]|uniref:substrate-binding domain-containing protein n=1 Tax=Notoacmeibacter ruber TaxID=2670375 RepID=UPI0013144D7E|nr:substrate-binding domain-containing protein [Notoacmeibacter ruber]
MLKRLIIALSISILPFSAPSSAATIGVTLANSDTFLKLLRRGLEEEAANAEDLTLQIEVSNKDSSHQMEAVEGFIEQEVDAIIAVLVDSDEGSKVSSLAEEAGIPLVYVNNSPINAKELPDGQTFVSADDETGGKLQAEEVCRLLKGRGNVGLMMGELTSPAARRRSDAVAAVLKTDACRDMKIVERQSANGARDQGTSVMGEWLDGDEKLDAVIANNDDMALGAVRIMTLRGIAMDDVVIAGIDATPAALNSMKAGELDVTVHQNAEGQGAAAVKAAMDLIAGSDVPPRIDIDSELITPTNLDAHMN